MNIRGDIKVFRDLYLKTGSSVPLEGKVITSVGSDGKTIWSDVMAPKAMSRAYNRGALVTDDSTTKLYMAIVDGASGDMLTNDLEWIDITRGSTSGNAETQENVTPTIDVGGVKEGIDILAGTDLEEFITELVSPTVYAEIRSDQSANININIPSVEAIGEEYTLNYNTEYYTGYISGYTENGNKTLVSLKGPASFDYSVAEGSQVIIYENNIFECVVTYAAGTQKIYNSDGSENTSFNRDGGVMTIKTVTEGYYPVYVGGTDLNPTELVSAIKLGNIPNNTKTINFKSQEIIRTSHTIESGLKYVFIALPVAKYSEFEVISQTFDKILDATYPTQSFILQLGNAINQTPYIVYTNFTNGYSADMPTTIKINNI